MRQALPRPEEDPAGEETDAACSTERAREAALRLLKVRPRTEAEVRRRLARKGFAQATQEAVLAELKRAGLVDDARFARYYVAQALSSKPQGRRALLHKLQALGIDRTLAAQAVAAGTQGQDELESARQLAARRLTQLRGLARPVLQRRLFGFLSRRGFSSEVVYRVVHDLTALEAGAGGDEEVGP